MTTCAQCGDCCELIGLPKPPEFFQQDEPTNDGAPWQLRSTLLHEFRFIRDHFHPVSRNEAQRINPRMTAPEQGERYFYTCDQFDATLRLCRAHDDRPGICRGFPWYGVPPYPKGLEPYPSCSYWRDIPSSLWPAGIEPLPDPAALPRNVC